MYNPYIVDAITYLKDYSKKSNRYLKTFFDKKRKSGGKIDKIVVDSINALEDYSLGGKKLRGALSVLGYQIAGGKNYSAILQVSCGIELLHSFILIHDDIIDKDKTRRGKQTLHKLFSRKKGEHFGISKAIVIGDIGAFLGYELIVNSEFPSDRLNKAILVLNDFLLKTMYGEMLDIDFDFKKKISWDEILKVRTYKTAYYTFVMPLVVGALLGGSKYKSLKLFEGYGVPIGIAFQLIDDILGVFGDPQNTGKSNENDIREGKKTFLYAKALELSKGEGKQFLLRWYGSDNLDEDKIAKIRGIIRGSGSLDYSQQITKEMTLKGKKFIHKITRDIKQQEMLASLADFIINRNR